MSNHRHVIVVMYDGPDSEAFISWMNGPHYAEVKATPGIVAARRYEVVDGPADRRRYVAILETDDLEATLAWRNSPDGQRSQREANERGVTNRYSVIGKLAYSTERSELG
jgi:heme-degrading monooxygenase HmoA